MQVTTVRLPDEVYERLRREAFEQRTSINALIVKALTDTAGDLE